MIYRRDIDGLRALAVAPVVLFHAFPSFFPGGYVGVDIFFVISGFLITGILMNDLEAGRFSLVEFYERRARRILPALAMVLLFTLTVCGFLYLPIDFKKFSGSLLATGVFTSNLFFWRTTGYFDGNVDIQPLLHTWSLAVEEQFYLFFPPLLALIWYRLRKNISLILLTLFTASLLGNILLTERAPQFSFYLLPTRAWELLLGSLLAVGAMPASRSAVLNAAFASFGLMLIGFSVLAYSRETLFPGIAALAPAFGAAFIIHAGAHGRHRVQPLLESRILVGLGLISYSLYLWHWPLLAMLRYYYFESPSVEMVVLVVALSVVAAAVSWRWIENPVRRRQTLSTKKSLFATAAALIAVCIILGATGSIYDGLPQRFSDPIMSASRISALSSMSAKDRSYCLEVTTERLQNNELCVIGVRLPGSQPSFVLWGDSHAETLRTPLTDLGLQYGKWGYFIGRDGCPPLVGVRRYNKGVRDSCLKLNNSVIDWIHRNSIKLVFMSARWALTISGERYLEENGERVMLSPGTSKDNVSIVSSSLTKTVDSLTEYGIRVILVSGVPEIGLDVPRVLLLKKYLNRTVRIAPTLEEFMQRNRTSLAILEATAVANDQVYLINPYKVFCVPETEQCMVDADGDYLYSDDNHLSVKGANLLTGILRVGFIK